MHIISAPFSGSCFTGSSSQITATSSQNKRYCTHWRMIPALFALSSFVLAVVTALFFNKRYLCLAHVPGGIGGLYLLYLAWQVPLLKTFEQNNHDLKESVEIARQHNVEMGLSLENLENQNHKLKQEVSSFNQANKDLAAQVSDLKTQKQALRRQVGSLNAEVSRFEVLNTQVAGTMQGLSTNLKQLGEDAETNHQKLGDDLESLQAVIEQLKQTTNHLKEAEASNKGTLQEQLAALSSILELMQAVLEPMRKWKDDKHMQQLAKIEKKLQKQQTRLIQECSRLEEQASNLTEHNEVLKEHGTQLNEALRSGLEILKQLKHRDQALDQTLTKATKLVETLESLTECEA